MTTNIQESKFRLNLQSSTTIILLAAILIWMVLQIYFSIPDSIVDDWLGWRQADTQTIARNFMISGNSIFYPQINWGGTGAGFVECEFQLYTYTIAKIMSITGESVLPGQILNLLFISLTAIIIYFTFKLHFKNQVAALTGSILFLVSNGPVHISTAIIPDGLCILFYSAGLYFFLKFLSDNKNLSLILFVLFSILAALIKPLALSLGIIQFFILLFGYRQLLKSPKIWAGWILILIVTGSYLLFSNGLYKEYGNTFGVLGGDSKFPTLKGLTVPIHYAKLLYMTVLWGLGPVGISAFIYLIIKRKITFYEWSLLIGNVIAIFVSMRYAVNQGYSPHYYIFAALLGVWFIAQSYKIIDENSRGKNYRRFIPVVTIFLIVAVYSVHLYSRVHPLKIHYDPEVTKLGYKLKEFIEPGNLVIVRSIAEEKERGEWGDRINNYEDPRIFYIANVKGWPLPSDYKGAALIARYAALGANYYAEPFNRKSDEERYDWLNTHGKLVFESDYGRIYKLYKN